MNSLDSQKQDLCWPHTKQSLYDSTHASYLLNSSLIYSMAECETRNRNKELTKTLSIPIFIQTLIIVEAAKTKGRWRGSCFQCGEGQWRKPGMFSLTNTKILFSGFRLWCWTLSNWLMGSPPTSMFKSKISPTPAKCQLKMTSYQS